MATLNTKTRKDYEEWLENIDDVDLKTFVFNNIRDEANFGSADFKLLHSGISRGEPIDCHMIQARVNGNTKDKQLKKLFNTSGSTANDGTHLAFALFPKSVADSCLGHHVRQALQESPVMGQLVVNKVHVRWNPDVKWGDDGQAIYQADVPLFLFEKIPFVGYNLEGAFITKKDKAKK